MRLANEIAAAAMEHVQGVLRPGMTCAQAAAEWQGFVHGEGTGWRGQVELALPFSLVWSGSSIKTFTATTDNPVVEGEPTLFEIWVCADGYWADHTKNLCPGALSPRYEELLDQLTAVYDDAVAFCAPGASLAELDRRVREGLAATATGSLPPDLPRHRRPRPRAAVRPPGRRRRDRRGHGARDRAGRATGPRAAACGSRTTS